MDENNARSGSFMRGTFGVLLGVLVLCGICLLIASFAANDKRLTGTEYTLESLHVWNTGKLPEPEAFLNEKAADNVAAVRYQRLPKDEIGTQTVALRLQLEDGTTRIETAALTLEEPEATWEIGTRVTGADLLGPEYPDAELTEALPMRVYPGTYSVNIRVGGEEIPFHLHAQDTTPPAVTFKDPLIFHVGALVVEKHFIESWEDICDEATFVLSSDVYTGEPGVYPISMTATDANGNGITYDLTYTVIE